MNYVIVFPNLNPLPGEDAGQRTMHYVNHTLDPFCLNSDWKLSNATVFDKFEDARAIEDLINEKDDRGIITTIMKVNAK